MGQLLNSPGIALDGGPGHQTVLVSFPGIIVYTLLQKQVVSGLAAGSVKG